MARGERNGAAKGSRNGGDKGANGSAGFQEQPHRDGAPGGSSGFGSSDAADPEAPQGPGPGHNVKSAVDLAWARILPAARELDEQIDAIITAEVEPLREERNKLFQELADLGVQTKVRVNRYGAYRIEMDAIKKGDDVTLAALHRAYQATPVGTTVNMLDVIKRADVELAKQAAAKTAADEAKTKGKNTEAAA